MATPEDVFDAEVDEGTIPEIDLHAQIRALMRALGRVVHIRSADTYEAFTLRISVDTAPVALLGLDKLRVRALIRANVTDVFVGRQEVLASYSGFQPVGYILPTQSGDEFKNIDELYVAYRPNPNIPGAEAFISVLVERSSVEVP